MKISDINSITLLCYKPAIKEREKYFKKTIECLSSRKGTIIDGRKYPTVNYHFAVPIPHFDKVAKFHRENIAKKINTLDTYYDKPSVFNCALNWYTIIKSFQGIDGIFMFLEDDCLIEDHIALEEILENAPNDFDLLRLHYHNPDISRMIKINSFWNKQEDFTVGEHCNCNFGCTACMIFKPKAIDFYCEFVEENGFLPADHPLMNTKGLNHYIHRSDIIKELSYDGIVSTTVQ